MTPPPPPPPSQQAGLYEEEVLLLQQQLQRSEAEVEEEEFWLSELRLEQESERQLRLQLGELQGRLHDATAHLMEYLARVQVTS